MRSRSLALVTLALCAAVTAVYAQERAVLYFGRTYDENAVQGRNVTFTYEIINLSDSAAYDVKINDLAVKSTGALVAKDGSFEADWPVVEANNNVTHRVVASAEKAGDFVLQPASLSYIAEAGSTDRKTAYSTVHVILKVESQDSYLSRTTFKVGALVAIILGISMFAVAPFVIYTTTLKELRSTQMARKKQ